MAYTSVVSIKDIKSSVIYIFNPQKTANGRLIGALLCRTSHAVQDMKRTKKRWHNEDGVAGYHLIQSFAEGEITKELAFTIAEELAQTIAQNGFEIVYSTHCNTHCYHNHFVWNSVNLQTGKKYRSNIGSYYHEIRAVSDSICEKYKLSVIEPSQEAVKSYAERIAEEMGKVTWRSAIREDIDELIKESFSFSQFIHLLKARGYAVKANGKYFAVRPVGKERFIRIKSLGERYTEDAIINRILQSCQKPKRFAAEPMQKRARLNGKFPSASANLRTIYLAYLYRLRAAQYRRRTPMDSYMRGELWKLDRKIAACRYLLKTGYCNVLQIQGRRERLAENLEKLQQERQSLYRKGAKERIAQLGEQIRECRKEMRLCEQIIVDSMETKTTLQKVRELSNEEVRLDEQRRRSSRAGTEICNGRDGESFGNHRDRV